jgi:hypothetical protein
VNNSNLFQYIRDTETANDYAVTPATLVKAKCWAVKNQGLMKKGLQQLAAESESLSNRQWFELVDVTQDFQKGSYLYVTEEDKKNIISEKFFGFRQRLEKRYSWLFAYYMKRFNETTTELEELLLEDPSMKVYHRIRPSQESAIQKAHETAYFKRKQKAEENYATLTHKLSQWNTYFGSAEERGLA